MTISEYIDELKCIKAEHGDLEVHRDSSYGRIQADLPVIAYLKIESRLQRRPDFWHESDYPSQKGEKVCRV